MDSLIVDFRIKKAAVKNEILGTLPIPNGARRTTDKIKHEYLVTENATSPLTKAGFTVKGIADDNGEHNLDICGYRVSANIPACTVGNNIANCNDWMNSHHIALLLLQHWLLENGCHPDAISAFDLEHAQTYKATPTFLIPFSSNEEARIARKALFDHAEAIYNYRYRNKPLNEDPVSMSGSSRNFTWYINTHNVKRFYIKSGRIEKGFYDFGGDQDLEDALFYFGGRHLRAECDFKYNWLKKNNILKPTDVKDDHQLFESMFKFIRKSLWADFEFRERNFKDEDLPKKGSVDRKLMKFYLAGKDVRQHPIVQNSYDANKYFSEVNKRARKHRVDYHIPWEIRKTMMCKGSSSSQYLNATLPFLPPTELAQHCFGPHTAPAIISDLQRRIDDAKQHYKTTDYLKKSHSHAAPDRDLDRDESDETSGVSDLMG